MPNTLHDATSDRADMARAVKAEATLNHRVKARKRLLPKLLLINGSKLAHSLRSPVADGDNAQQRRNIAKPTMPHNSAPERLHSGSQG